MTSPDVGDYRGFRIKRYPGIGWQYELVPEEGKPAYWDGHSWVDFPDAYKTQVDVNAKARILHSDLSSTPKSSR